ncbi:hypothetical protein [Cobetia sp. L2A1]|uniref:hypothetical protein n=1 Tax=Cobetia sp. L2A1 TaxID=2686360 RepID=UPI001E3594A4|nr:hypothetical protein [Cobetia sp. L2A1]
MHEYEPETGDFPAFIAVETGEDSSLPLAIAWALPDGQMKHVLIQPDDEWLDNELLELGDYSLEDLRSFGVSPLDVLKELEQDYYQTTLYTTGINDDEHSLARLFDAYNMDPFIEFAPAESLYPEFSPGEWARERNNVMFEQGLQPFRPDNEVLVMLAIHTRLRGDGIRGDEIINGTGPDYEIDWEEDV